MRLNEMAEKLGLECLTPEVETSECNVIEGYVSDLLSDVLAHGPADGVLITVQVHLNVVAVATHAGLSAVVFAMGRQPDDAVREKAIEEGIALFASPESSFELVGRLYGMGVRGPEA